ncbi:MAG: tetratricopeptide repeat protein [Sulfurifustis sp.]
MKMALPDVLCFRQVFVGSSPAKFLRFTIFHRFTLLRLLAAVALLAIGVLVYLPGLHGPFIFDDFSNLLDNPYLKITSLDLKTLWLASFSQNAGPLQRPVAMASFAINSYFAGGFASAVPFRVVNIAVHLVNGVLVYWFLRLVIECYRERQPRAEHRLLTSSVLAAALAFVWLVHPINLTSVLYIVQRMTSLSGLFVLLALVTYMHGRLRARTNKVRGYATIAAGVVIFGGLGAYTKESALLLPAFIVILDLLLFRDEQPWKQWESLSPRIKASIVAAGVVVLVVFLILAVEYALPTYRNRTFTMWERVLTESRVLVMYLSLIAFPRLDALGMFHDDIGISHSLLDPPTTLLSILALAGLSGVAVAVRRKAPLFTLGIAWFFAGHLLESTIFSLEIAHEHRNYLASLALPFCLAALALKPDFALQPKGRLALILALASVFATVTYFRSAQWSSDQMLCATEVRHHPNSPRALDALGRTLANHGKTSEGLALVRRSTELDTAEAGGLINMLVYMASIKEPIDTADVDTIDKRLAAHPTTATTDRSLVLAANCVIHKCPSLARHLERWVRTVLSKKELPDADRSFYYQFLGRALVAQGKANEAIDAYRASYNLDGTNLPALFDIAEIYLAAGRLQYAEVIAGEIRRVNARVRLPRINELQDLESRLAKAKVASK